MIQLQINNDSCMSFRNVTGFFEEDIVVHERDGDRFYHLHSNNLDDKH